MGSGLPLSMTVVCMCGCTHQRDKRRGTAHFGETMSKRQCCFAYTVAVMHKDLKIPVLKPPVYKFLVIRLIEG